MLSFLNGMAFPGARLLVERTISGSGEDAGGFGGSSVNLVFIVALAIGISFLAQWLSRRGRRK